MREHYNLDDLADYGTDSLPGSTRVVNPQYRALNSEMRNQAARLARKRSKFDAIDLHDDIEPDVVAAYETKKSAYGKRSNIWKRTWSTYRPAGKQRPGTYRNSR